MKKIKSILFGILMFALLPVLWACNQISTLSTPSDVSLDEETYVVSWGSVDDADYYGVEINGKIYQTKTNSLDVSSYVENSGEYQIRIKAFTTSGKIKNSSFSKTVNLVKKERLSTPQISLNAQTGDLSWEQIEGAYYYVLSINNVSYLTTQSSFNMYSITSFDDYILRGQINKFKVCCAATSDYLNSLFSEEIQMFIANIQETPKNVKVEKVDDKYEISFDRVATAYEYIVNISGSTYSTQNNKIDTAIFSLGFGEKTVTVKAKEVRDDSGNLVYMQSAESKPVKFEYKPKFVGKSVENLSLSGQKVLTFDAMQDAAGYQINVDGKTYQTANNFYDLSDILVNAKSYQISVVATNGIYQSDSTVITYKNILKLDSPDFEFVEPSTSRLVERHISINTRYNVLVAYKIYFRNGHIETSQAKNIDITDYLEIGENQISVEVICDDEYYESSNIVTKIYEYYLLSQPSNLNIDQNKVLTFDGSESTTETFKIYVKHFGDNWGQPVITTAETTVSLETYLVETGKYEIGVSSFDDGIDSSIASISFVISEVLNIPQNLSVIQQTDDKAILSFDQIDNATGYELYIDGSLKTVLDSHQNNDITSYVNVGSDTTISIKAVGDGEVYLTSASSQNYVFTYVKEVDEVENVYVEASAGKYYLFFEPVTDVMTYSVQVVDGNEQIVYSNDIDQSRLNLNTNLFKVDIDQQITKTDEYEIIVQPNVNSTYYLSKPTKIRQVIKLYEISEYESQKFFYCGKNYTYAVKDEFEIGEAALHAMLYRKDSIEVYLNFDYDGIQNAYSSETSLIQDMLPVVNNIGIDLNSLTSSNILIQLFTSGGNLADIIKLVERAHDQMYLYISGVSHLTSQKSDRVYTIEFDYSNAGKYQADETHSQNESPEYAGRTTSKTFPIDNCDEVDVETVSQLIMVASYGKKPRFINQNSSELNHIAEDTYNSARYILSQICTDGMSDYEVVKAIHDWIVLNNTYDHATCSSAEGTPFSNSNLSDMAFFASGTILKNLSVCLGYAQTFSLMCGIMGIKSVVTFGLVGNGINWPVVNFSNYLTLLLSGLLTNVNKIGGHSWNRVYISTPQNSQKAWYIVDCTWDDPDNNQAIKYDYFLKRDYDVAETRKELYPTGAYYHEKDESGVEINYSATTIFVM